MEPVGTGFESIDTALGGLITGDNVVWLTGDDALYHTLSEGFVGKATRGGGRCLYVDFGGGSFDGDPRVDRIDASARSRLGRPSPLADELERRVRSEHPACLVVDRLSRVARRWRRGDPANFFARVCPAMLQAGVTAYWQIDDTLGRTFVDQVRQITQCLLDVRSGRLRVLKAEGRPDALQGIAYRLHVEDGDVHVESAPAGGRLARGMAGIRQQLGLTQHELAAVAGVTPSAISQAEAGTRGLSLDTVVTIADRLDVSVDRLLGASVARSYRLARHDRARRLAGGQVIALAPDSTVGMRVYLVELDAMEEAGPPFEHRGIATIAVLRGLMQVDVDEDRPVLRAGDVLIADTDSVKAWRNLRPEPAACYWTLRD